MAVHALTTAISNLIDRIVVLEPLSIAQVTANTTADKMWLWNSPSYPFWCNRPTRLVSQQRRELWTLNLTGRLYLSHIAAGTVGTTTPQDQAWSYIPECLLYFEAVRTTLAPTGYAEITYLAPEGLTIQCPRGLDYLYNPATNAEALYIDFEFSVPFTLMGT